ncbi:MAG: hypothetical protein JO297_17940 [Nitrososphaeraceae archaeon]|nr:hypothetical protein [Nitrososphaeraceae archaeon]
MRNVYGAQLSLCLSGVFYRCLQATLFDKLVTSLRIAVEREKGVWIKKALLPFTPNHILTLIIVSDVDRI